MLIGKIDAKDLVKLAKKVEQSKFCSFINVSVDGPKLCFSFEDADGRLCTVTIFDSSAQTFATITKTEML